MKAKVTKGANFLDLHLPGWAGKINKAKLKMDSDTQCVIGQLAKKVGKTAIAYSNELGLVNGKTETHGFEGDAGDTKLADLWRAEIDKRLTPPKLATEKKKPAKKKALV